MMDATNISETSVDSTGLHGKASQKNVIFDLIGGLINMAAVFWVVKPCSPVDTDRCFGGT
jgi:hypothetical protein